MTKTELTVRVNAAKDQLLALVPDNVDIVEAEGTINEAHAQGECRLQLDFLVSYADPTP